MSDVSNIILHSNNLLDATLDPITSNYIRTKFSATDLTKIDLRNMSEQVAQELN